MVEHIGRLVQQTETYSKDTHGKIIDAFFNDHQNSECAVILDEGKPIGLVTRNDFYQKIGSQFGYTIYMTRPVYLIMNKTLLTVEARTDVNEAVFLALKREQVNLYDPLVVTENGLYIGIVSIKLFLIELTRQREKEISLLMEQQSILKRANEAEMRHGLMMEEKNQLLGSKNQAIKNLLDNAGQGFLSFGEEMVISDEYSYECINIFGAPIGGRNFLELIGTYIDSGQKEIMKEVFENVFRNIHRPQTRAYLSLLPGEINVCRKNIRVDYKVIPALPGPRIMLILTDITEKKELELRMIRERENLKLIIKAISNSSDITAYMENMREFICSGAKEIINSNHRVEDKFFEIYRVIHTFKGDFSQLCMYNTANGLHSLENALSKMADTMGSLDEKTLLRCMEGVCCDLLLEKDLKIIADALGGAYLSKGESFAVSKEKILGIEKTIVDCIPAGLQGSLLPLVRNLRHTCFKEIVRSYGDYLKTIARNSDKCIGDMVITGDDIYIDKGKYHAFTGSLVHLFKNMADHGIETTEERVAARKPEEGRIECEFRRMGEKEFFLYIRDDGKGIDFTRIRNKLREKKIKLPKEYSELSVNELQEVLFMNGFSTRDSVSITSGRGMGLGAVRSEVVKLGGDISIATVPGKGTEFKIRLPVL